MLLSPTTNKPWVHLVLNLPQICFQVQDARNIFKYAHQVSSASGENKMREKITPYTEKGKKGYTFSTGMCWNTEV